MGRDGARPVLIVTPYSLDTNPYVRLLVEALRAEGIRVELARGRSPILLLRALRRHGIPRVVHLQWHHPYLTADRLSAAVGRTLLFFAQWALLRVLGARFVWTVHNRVDHERRNVQWELLACRMLVRMVDAPLAHCRAAANEVAAAYRIPEDRVGVVPHGVFTVTGGPDRARVRQALGVAETELLLLNFGRIRPYKGVDRLLATFQSVGGSQVELIVAGFPDDAAFGATLERQAAGDPRIRLRLEAVEDEELSGLLSACDAVVLPYRDSLTSGAAILAAAHGRAVIAPRLGCLREWPEDGGILYDDDAEDGLARALSHAEDAPLAAMGAVAQRHVERYPWKRVAERTEDVYRYVSGGFAAARAGL